MIPVIMNKATAKVDWSGIIGRPPTPPGEVPRGTIGSMSKKSARRLTCALLDAPKDWGVMVTLTFREVVLDGRPALRRWMRLLRERGLGHLQWGWVREYQARGSVHYHWLWEREGLASAGLLSEVRPRPYRPGQVSRLVVGGPLERRVVDSWSEAVGDTSQEFQRFQQGGIVELLEHATSAGRYFGSYMAKQEQKTLPAGGEKCGRWWAMSEIAKPKPGKRMWLTGWPFNVPLGTVFDNRKLEGMVSDERPTITMPKHPSKVYAKRKYKTIDDESSHVQRVFRMRELRSNLGE